VTVHPLRLALLTRNVDAGRFGTLVTRWFARECERSDEFKLDLIDLSAVPLAGLPARIEDADAVVIVTAEYNHAYPGDLKTAIDAVRRPWYGKPIAFVVYGGRSGGLRAADEELGAKGFRQSAQWQWGGPGDGTRSRDEMRALDALELESDADFKAVKAAHRRLVKETHPDANPGDEQAAKRFKQVQAAYDVLKKAEERNNGKTTAG